MTESEYNAALDALEARMARDYLAQASTLRASASLTEILALIRAGDALAVARQYTGANYSALLESARAAFLQGGAAEAATFDIRRPSANAWLQNNAVTTLEAIRQEQAAAVEVTMTAARLRGDTPAQIARQIVGEFSPVTGNRYGGVAGLTGQDAQFVQNARDQLLSLDRAYFTRTRRDRRFDAMVLRAINAGKPLASADIDRITQRYAWRLLQTRADTVASIEALENYNGGRQQMYTQLVEDGVSPRAITKRWKTRGDEKVRASHRAMNGQTVPGDGFFITPRGARMLNPGDMSNGAGVSEVARCRCRAIYTIKEQP